jgi:hypothetical protein
MVALGARAAGAETKQLVAHQGQTEGVPWIFKWEQPPDLDTSGVDVAAQLSEPGVVLADDFWCMTPGPIALIFVWGSWLWDEVPGDPSNVTFTLSIHADIPDPDGPGPLYSMPGEVLWMREFVPGEFVVDLYQMDLMESWYDPLQGYYEPNADSVCWLYQFHVPAGEAFVQEGTNPNPIVYWFDVQANPWAPASFGWKTAMDHFKGDATWGVGTDPPPDWFELRYPAGHQWAGQSIDLAFALYTVEADGACCCDDATCTNMLRADCEALGGCTYRGEYTACEGLEACCHGEGACADIDGLCCAPIYSGARQGPQSQCAGTSEACCLEGTYPDDCVNAEAVCCDDVGGILSPFGAPACLGDLDGNGTNDACEAPTGACCRGPFCSVETSGDCDALDGIHQGDGTDCDPPNPCAAAAACCLPDGTCVSTDHLDCVVQGGDPQAPGDTCEKTVCAPIKWSQPPSHDAESDHPECFWGWDELSAYHAGPIIADDWPCDSDRPVSAIHWWGSYEGWDGTVAPSSAPLHFVLGIWTDVPAGVDEPFSHPGEMIWQSWVDRAELNERPVACDYHPDFMTVPEGCFRYDYKIPREQWFFQDQACSIYWLSIAPAYPIQEPGKRGIPNLWGWKTRGHLFMDDAVRILDPVAPELGQAFAAGAPIEDLDGTTWDMAFVLTTSEPGKWEQPPDLTLSGLHAHDWYDSDDQTHRWLTLADQWRCGGGRVTGFHWWGAYEDPGSGIDHFHLSIHAHDEQTCLPGPPLWEMDVPYAEASEAATDWTNGVGYPVYCYEFILPEPFVQEEGEIYWLDISSYSNDDTNPSVWYWLESSRQTEFSICPAAERGDSFPWHHLEWPQDPARFSEMAFRVTSSPAPDAPDPPPGEPGYDKVRYLSFVPSSPGVQTAIRVTFAAMPPPYAGFAGEQMWVGPVQARCENGGVSEPPCPAVPPLPSSFQSANLECAPHCSDYGSVGALHVTDDEIIPNAVYEVQIIDCASDFGNELAYSDPLTIDTSRWGDLVGNCTVLPCTAPDGVVNVTTDVTAVLDKFKNLPGAVMKSRADLDPNVPEWLVNITDVTAGLDAFLGFTYPPTGWPGPGGCP